MSFEWPSFDIFFSFKLCATSVLMWRVSEEVILLLCWHEWDTFTGKSIHDIERCSVLFKISVPVESSSIFSVKHQTISVGSISEGDWVFSSINTSIDSPDIGLWWFRVECPGFHVWEVASVTIVGSELVAFAHLHSSDECCLLDCVCFKCLLHHTLLDSLPSVWFSRFDKLVIMISKLSSKEITVIFVFPHVDCIASSSFDNASSNLPDSKSGWFTSSFKHILSSAFFHMTFFTLFGIDELFTVTSVNVLVK